MLESMGKLPNALRIQLHAALTKWYRKYGRHDLPWRVSDDAYHIYVSEVMLQQTQVKTVLERYYFPFLKRFPTLAELAVADEVEVLKAWEGLGYYSRARYLHQTAKRVKGRLPSNVAELMALPGIGRNTAHAIASFAYRQPVPVLEANVKRVMARLMAWESPSDAMLWQAADWWLDRDNPFDYNQAMMDVGSMVCTPKTPSCDVCPLAVACAGKGMPERYPQKKPKKKVPARRRVLSIVESDEGALLLVRRQTRFLNGLYGFVEYPHEAWCAPEGSRKIGDISHTYSHFRLEAEVYYQQLKSRANMPEGEWVTKDALGDHPMSGADYKALKLLGV